MLAKERDIVGHLRLENRARLLFDAHLQLDGSVRPHRRVLPNAHAARAKRLAKEE
jgi:hypothetical protein